MKTFSIITLVIVFTWLSVNVLASIGCYYDLTPSFITTELIEKSFIGLGGWLYMSTFGYAGASIIIMTHTQKDID